jgi:hypothetical protein
MALSVAGEDPISRMQATVLNMQQVRPRNSATRCVWDVSRPDGAGKRQPYFDDAAVLVWVVALIGIVILAGAVIMLALISATVTVSPRIAGPTLEDGATTGSDENGAVLVDDDWVYGPKLTR